ncbi:MAG: putative toxin-antitoxin system toxin component, PIN family [Anaerolineae bacterium]|nr:putative toxin-antitoxin system toxin component, PIN family [Anaerolineae bacterium]
MRVVIDTNVLVSALIRPNGRVGEVLRHLRQGDYTLLYAPALLEELVDVLTRPRIRDKYGITEDDVKTTLALFLLRGEAVVPEDTVTACRDPKDNKFLEVAVAGEANALVSGDEDLLVLDPFEGIPIITPAEFLHRLDAGQ